MCLTNYISIRFQVMWIKNGCSCLWSESRYLISIYAFGLPSCVEKFYWIIKEELCCTITELVIKTLSQFFMWLPLFLESHYFHYTAEILQSAGSCAALSRVIKIHMPCRKSLVNTCGSSETKSTLSCKAIISCLGAVCFRTVRLHLASSACNTCSLVPLSNWCTWFTDFSLLF